MKTEVIITLSNLGKHCEPSLDVATMKIARAAVNRAALMRKKYVDSTEILANSLELHLVDEGQQDFFEVLRSTDMQHISVRSKPLNTELLFIRVIDTP